MFIISEFEILGRIQDKNVFCNYFVRLQVYDINRKSLNYFSSNYHTLVRVLKILMILPLHTVNLVRH